MHTVIRENVIRYRRVSVVEPSNVSCCDQSDPCSSDWFESWNLIVILVLEIISIALSIVALAYLSLVRYSDVTIEPKLFTLYSVGG